MTLRTEVRSASCPSYRSDARPEPRPGETACQMAHAQVSPKHGLESPHAYLIAKMAIRSTARLWQPLRCLTLSVGTS